MLRDGLIVSVEAGGAVPSDAVAIDATDRFIYAGLIDAGGDLLSADESPDGGRAADPGNKHQRLYEKYRSRPTLAEN